MKINLDCELPHTAADRMDAKEQAIRAELMELSGIDPEDQDERNDVIDRARVEMEKKNPKLNKQRKQHLDRVKKQVKDRMAKHEAKNKRIKVVK